MKENFLMTDETPSTTRKKLPQWLPWAALVVLAPVGYLVYQHIARESARQAQQAKALESAYNAHIAEVAASHTSNYRTYKAQEALEAPKRKLKAQYVQAANVELLAKRLAPSGQVEYIIPIPHNANQVFIRPAKNWITLSPRQQDKIRQTIGTQWSTICQQNAVDDGGRTGILYFQQRSAPPAISPTPATLALTSQIASFKTKMVSSGLISSSDIRIDSTSKEMALYVGRIGKHTKEAPEQLDVEQQLAINVSPTALPAKEKQYVERWIKEWFALCQKNSTGVKPNGSVMVFQYTDSSVWNSKVLVK